MVILHLCVLKDLIVIFLCSVLVEGLKIKDAFVFTLVEICEMASI